MTFEVSDCVYLVTWIVFIFWEISPMRRESTEWYTTEAKSASTFNVPWAVFPFVWLVLKAALVASIYLFLRFSVSVEDWTFLTVYVAFVVNIFMAKTWSLLFFEMRAPVASFFVAIALWLTAVLVLVVMIVAGVVTNNLGTLWYAPMILYCPYVAWLTFAVILNMDWISVKSLPGQDDGLQIRFKTSMGLGAGEAKRHAHRHHLADSINV